MEHDRALRDHLLALLAGGAAHLTFDEVVADFPAQLRGVRPTGAPHTAWQLVEHLRLAQWDILEFSRDPRHVSPAFPAGYWPSGDAPPAADAWSRSVAAFRSDLEEMKKLVGNPKIDLFAQIRHPDATAEHTVLRQALLAADHNAYHLGQLLLLRRLLGAW